MAQTDPGRGAMSQASKNVVEDPREPEWKKRKELDQIEMFRETNKEFLINNMMNDFSADAKTVPLIPGEITFETLHLRNNTGSKKLYTVQIQDPDQMSDEVRFVYSAAEYIFWYDQGKVNTKLPSQDCFANIDTVKLEDGDQMDLLFKF